MLLRFESTVEDLLAFQDYQYAHSSTVRRRLARKVGALSLISFGGMISMSSHDGVINAAVSGLIVAGLVALVCPSLVRYNMKAHIRKMCVTGDYKLFLGDGELEIVEDGIISRTPYGEGKLAWGAIEQIESTAEYTFIYVGTLMAMIIPHNRIEEGDYKVFMTELGRHYKPDQKLQSKIRQ